MKSVMLAIVGWLLTAQSFSQRKELYFAWPVNDATGKIEFSESVYMPGSPGDTLYKNALEFVTNTFTGARDSMLVKNDTTRSILYRAAYNAEVKELGDRGKGYIYFAVSIRCNNSSYRYSFTNFQHFPLLANGVAGGPLENETAASGGRLFPSKYWNEEKAKCYHNVQAAIEQLKQFMNKNSNPDL